MKLQFPLITRSIIISQSDNCCIFFHPRLHHALKFCWLSNIEQLNIHIYSPENVRLRQIHMCHLLKLNFFCCVSDNVSVLIRLLSPTVFYKEENSSTSELCFKCFMILDVLNYSTFDVTLYVYELQSVPTSYLRKREHSINEFLYLFLCRPIIIVEELKKYMTLWCILHIFYFYWNHYFIKIFNFLSEFFFNIEINYRTLLFLVQKYFDLQRKYWFFFLDIFRNIILW